MILVTFVTFLGFNNNNALTSGWAKTHNPLNKPCFCRNGVETLSLCHVVLIDKVLVPGWVTKPHQKRATLNKCSFKILIHLIGILCSKILQLHAELYHLCYT